MIGSAKTMGSLSSSLLARKGQARPAMRSQGLMLPGAAPIADDLGWNDMGASAPASIATGEPVPQVLVEREALKASIAAPAAVKSVSVPTAARLQRETAHVGKSAAFTLRVDAAAPSETAPCGCDHQPVRTGSGDAGARRILLDSVPEVEALVAQLPRQKSIR